MKIDAKAFESRLILIAGPEGSLRSEALERALAANGANDDEFDLEVVDGDSEPDHWLASAQTAPFLAERRTVVVRHLLRSNLDKASELDWTRVPESGLLILVADEEQGDEDRQRRYAAAERKWVQIVNKAKGSLINAAVSPTEIVSEIRRHIEAANKKITPKAIQLLKDMTGSSLSRAIEELPKLFTYVGEQETIQEADVRAIVFPSPEWSIFTLLDAATEGNTGGCLAQLQTILGSGNKVEGVALASIMPQLSRTLRVIWQARVCVEAGCTPQNAPDSVRAFFLDKPNIAAEKDYPRNKAMRAAKELDFRRLGAMIAITSEADAQLKGALPSYSGIEALEQMAVKLCATASGRG